MAKVQAYVDALSKGTLDPKGQYTYGGGLTAENIATLFGIKGKPSMSHGELESALMNSQAMAGQPPSAFNAIFTSPDPASYIAGLTPLQNANTAGANTSTDGAAGPAIDVVELAKTLGVSDPKALGKINDLLKAGGGFTYQGPGTTGTKLEVKLNSGLESAQGPAGTAGSKTSKKGGAKNAGGTGGSTTDGGGGDSGDGTNSTSTPDPTPGPPKKTMVERAKGAGGAAMGAGGGLIRYLTSPSTLLKLAGGKYLYDMYNDARDEAASTQPQQPLIMSNSQPQSGYQYDPRLDELMGIPTNPAGSMPATPAKVTPAQ